MTSFSVSRPDSRVSGHDLLPPTLAPSQAAAVGPGPGPGLETDVDADLLTGWEQVPLVPPEELSARIGRRVLIVAPHPDDETLGCAGLVRLLVQAHGPEAVRVAVLSDGTRSHPGSRKFPPAARRALRETETITALRLLGLDAGAVRFLGWPDAAVPGSPEHPDFGTAAEQIRSLLTEQRPETVLTTWRGDPHCDHRAASRLVGAALSMARKGDLLAGRPAPRRLEFPVWAWQSDQPADRPTARQVRAWRLDVASVLAAKRAAVAAHRSQTSDLIDDDPTGFRLAPDFLSLFDRPWEMFLEPLAAAC